jgi:hypothetical protein
VSWKNYSLRRSRQSFQSLSKLSFIDNVCFPSSIKASVESFLPDQAVGFDQFEACNPGEVLGQCGFSDSRCAGYEYDVAQVCDLVLRPGHSGSLEPFEPGSPDRESGILSAKIVDRAILPEQRLPQNKFQLRISRIPVWRRFKNHLDYFVS